MLHYNAERQTAECVSNKIPKRRKINELTGPENEKFRVKNLN